jgi:hypothetical protein
MRHFFQPKAGRSLPISSGLHVASGKSEGTGSCYLAEGRKLHCHKESTQMQDGIPVTRAWYRCESCENCPQRERCCRKQDINAPKEVIWKKTFWEKREVSLQNIASDQGICLGQLCCALKQKFGL